MKVRFIEVIGTQLRISFKGDKKSISFGCFSKDVSVTNPPFNISWESIKNIYPDMNGWGFLKKYNTKSGNPEPGDMYYSNTPPKDFYWDNQEEANLILILPNGCEWNIDSRASNCTEPQDRKHRCWCKHGIPPFITVNKIGRSCKAGAGSILISGFHGMLINGEIKQL